MIDGLENTNLTNNKIKMNIGKLILGALFTLSFGLINYAQAGSTEADECTRYKAIAGNAYKAKEYEKVTRSYVRALKECGTLELVFYNPFIYSVQKSMNNATVDSTKAAYLDTLISVYESAQETHGVQKEWQSYLGYYYMMQGKPGNMKKADEAYRVGIHHDAEKVNKGFLQQYYVNLYNLWVQEQDEKAKAKYKKRIITEYFKLSDYANKGEMGAEIIDFVSVYMERAVTDCESILPEITSFMKELPQEIEAKKSTVKNFMALIEKQECTKSEVYAQLVDTIIAIDPSVDAVLAKAKLQISRGNTNGALSTFKDALKMAENADQKSEIEFEIANVYFRSGSYKSAHNAGIAVTGKNSGRGYEIAAQSVSAMSDDCGVSTFERKANYYYAVELAENSGNSALISSMKSKAPSSSDIFNETKSEGELVELKCWGKTYPIKLY
jgi:tetratricopeptide (TPR) repeat protein